MTRNIELKHIEILDKPLVPESARGCLHMVYAFSGKGFLTADSSSYPCSKDSLFLFSALELLIPRGSVSLLYLSFQCTEPDMRLELLRLPKSFTAPAHFSHLMFEILREHTLRRDFYQTVESFYLEEMLFSLIILHKRKTPLLPVPASGSPALDPLVSYIRQHCGEELSPHILSSRFHMDSKQLNRLFEFYTGLTTMQFITSMRIEKARELLHFSSLSITEIAEATGFHSIHYFSKIFKSIEGISPLQYKQRLKSLRPF